MNMRDIVQLALIYEQVPTKIRAQYMKLIDSTAEQFSLADAKSIRFENNPKKVSSIRNTCEKRVTVKNPLDNNTEVEVFKYTVNIRPDANEQSSSENGWRYLYFSELFPTAVYVRPFYNYKKYHRLLKNTAISVKSELECRGAHLAVYSSSGSDVERVAIFCEDACSLTPLALTEVMELIPNGVVDKTSMFN